MNTRTALLIVIAVLVLGLSFWYATRTVPAPQMATTTSATTTDTTKAPVKKPLQTFATTSLPKLVPPPSTISPTSTSASVPWRLYENKTIGFSLSYPSTWYTSTYNNKALISATNPGSDKSGSDVGLISTLTVSVASLQDYSQSESAASKTSAVFINGVSSARFEIPEGTAGGHLVEYFFPIKTDAGKAYLEVRFEGNVPSDLYPFDAIAKTVHLIARK